MICKQFPGIRCVRGGGWAALLLLSLVAGGARGGVLERVAQEGTLTLGYRESSPPFSYVADGQPPQGYSIDLCLRVVDAVRREVRREVRVRYRPVTSADRIEAVAQGRVDLECGTTTSTAERRRHVAFTIPTFIAATRLLVRTDSGIGNLTQLAGRTVVTTAGTTAEKLFLKLNAERTLRAHLITARDHAESFALLEAGKADAFIMDDVLLSSLRAASAQPERYAILRDMLNVEPLAIMLPRDDPGFKKLVDREVTQLIVEREIDGLYRRWFESPIPPAGVNLRLPMSYLLRDSFKAPTDWLPD